MESEEKEIIVDETQYNVLKSLNLHIIKTKLIETIRSGEKMYRILLYKKDIGKANEILNSKTLKKDVLE